MKYAPIKKEIKSILRYPGGKSKALKYILPHIPSDFSEFREPFIGGGSIFLAVKHRVPSNRIFRVNDLNQQLMSFWMDIMNDPHSFQQDVISVKEKYSSGKALFLALSNNANLTETEKRVRYFILNRISFSGLVDAGGYSDESYHKRFTDSIIKNIPRLGHFLNNAIMTVGDYSPLLKLKGDNVFIFVDPPYSNNRDSKLYGKKGILHQIFDHERLSYQLYKTNHRWVATYDDTPLIHELYDFAYKKKWSLNYGMTNVKKKRAKKGGELIISNYPLDTISQKKFI